MEGEILLKLNLQWHERGKGFYSTTFSTTPITLMKPYYIPPPYLKRNIRAFASIVPIEAGIKIMVVALKFAATEKIKNW